MDELGMSYEHIEVPGGSHSSVRYANIDKVFASCDKHRKRSLSLLQAAKSTP